MDEPSGRAGAAVRREVLRVLNDLQGRGRRCRSRSRTSASSNATRVSVLEGGRIHFSGTVAEMTDNEALRRAYFD
jgi:branched-chain amino acid transport system ATP-binding protein